VIDRTGAPGATPPEEILADLDPRYEHSGQISTPRKLPFFGKDLWQGANPWSECV
jgi:hypothetical protein